MQSAKDLWRTNWALGGVLKPLLESFTVAIPSIGVSYTLQGAREELGKSLKNSSDSLLKMLVDMTKLHEKNFEAIRQTMEGQLRNLREDNSKKLEQMRATVDEKLQSTLEKRLGESFKQVSERLEQVYKGLGEMRTLATGVGDLKKVLTNVKTRGTWGGNQAQQHSRADLNPG